MSKEVYNEFIRRSVEGINNKNQRRIDESLCEHYKHVLSTADSFYQKPKLAKERAVFIKNKAIQGLEQYLVDFDSNFTKRGGKIIWAQNEEEAIREISKILKDKNIKTAVKSNCMLADEIDLNTHLEEQKIEVVETELNTFSQRIQDKKIRSSYFPILDNTLQETAETIQQKYALNEPNVEATIDFIRKYFINTANQTQLSIFGADFMIADIGGVAVFENQGNINPCTAFAEIQIALVGLDKMLPSIADLELFTTLFSTHTSEDLLPKNIHILTGPRQEYETDGPKEMYLVIIDNGRTKVLEQKTQRRALHCIYCGACAAVCPVRKMIGHDAYGNVYSGPLGNVLAPLMYGFYYDSHLSNATTSCGRCTEVCPMNIPLHELMIYNRKDSVEKEFYVTIDRSKMRQLKKMMLKRKQMDSSVNTFMLKFNFKKAFGNQRVFPDLSQRSFSIRWQDMHDLK